MKLSIITGVAGNLPITEQWFEETIANCEQQNQIILVSNGNTEKEWVRLNELFTEYTKYYGSNDCAITYCKEPLGSSAALNIGAASVLDTEPGRILVFIHNDLMIREKGWDTRLIEFYENTPNVGVVGTFGARQLGAHDIYTKPYELTQLGRAYCYSNLEDWQHHGDHTDHPMKVAVVDGMFVACLKEDFELWGKFDERYIHHMYDNDICVRSYYNGKNNYVLPLLCRHISGQTANFSTYGDWLREKYGKTDGDIHRESHKIFYDTWTDRLPVIV